MQHAHPVRVDLKMRTVFNLLGPLTNPAGATAQIIGAPSLHAAELMAGAIMALGMQHGFVVHGSDGLDEITTTGPTSAWEIRDGTLEPRQLEPADFAVHTAQTEDLRGGDRQVNLEIANSVLAGALGPRRDIVLVNAAAALVAAGKAETFLEGMALGVMSIDSGAARGKVAALAGFGAGG
jgi:anthranilate phosphoribosyltransferase